MYKTIIKTSIIFSLALAVFVLPRLSLAQGSTQNLKGWAWSSNIGWISFNSTDLGGADCGTYCVSVDSSGAVSGYAWSPSIGWLSFASADLSGCPSATGVTLSKSDGKVTGWARFLAGVTKPGSWDGCLKLSDNGASPSYFSSPDQSGNKGVTMDPTSGAFKGFAWGGSVVGWVNFAPSLTSVSCPGCGVVNTLTGICSNDAPSSITPGTKVNFTISGVSGGSGNYTYTFSPGDGGASQVVSNIFSYIYNNTGTFNASVNIKDNTTGITANSICSPTVTVGVPPSGGASDLKLTIGTDISNADKNNITVTKGRTFALKWTNNTDPSVYLCGAKTTNNSSGSIVNYWDIGISNPYWNGDIVSSKTFVNKLPTKSVDYGQYKFSIICKDISGNIPPKQDIESSVILYVKSSTIKEK